MCHIPRGELSLFAGQTVPIGWDKLIDWLSDSPNRAWQVCDSLTEHICTHVGCQGEYTVSWSDRNYLATRPGILASTCKAFDLWLRNPRVSGRGGSGPGRLSGMPLECTWITALEEACSEGGGRVPDILILGATTFHDPLASERVVGIFFLGLGDCAWLLGATMEGITDGQWDRPQALDGRAERSGGNGLREVPKGILE